MTRLRREHQAKERDEKSLRISDRFLALDAYERARVVLAYYPKPGEVDTGKIISKALSDGKTVLLPKIIAEGKVFEARKIDSVYELSRGAYGIMEPPAGAENIPFEKIDIVIVPGVAFDRHGNRVGHGKGYYDEALKKMNGARKVALAFDFQIIDGGIPAEAHDIKVDEIITESRRINAKGRMNREG
jgi:5-formyltetrahydrofolate cyclo-ligase